MEIYSNLVFFILSLNFISIWIMIFYSLLLVKHVKRYWKIAKSRHRIAKGFGGGVAKSLGGAEGSSKPENCHFLHYWEKIVLHLQMQCTMSTTNNACTVHTHTHTKWIYINISREGEKLLIEKVSPLRKRLTVSKCKNLRQFLLLIQT